MRFVSRAPWSVILILALAPAIRADVPSADFQPDPKSVERYGPAYRYPQAGWIVLHVEGEPYERGYQHGRLLATEIAAHLRCFAATQNHKAPTEGWRTTRTLINAVFLRRFDREYLEEMKGIADGASDAGARFDNRPIDLVDVVGLNVWPEIDTLESALDATPTGLEGMRFPREGPKPMPRPKPEKCSAFAATGPATADGGIVFGHITMFGLYPASFYNVWLDVKPTKGYRVMMQGFPAGIQSGQDYYLNSAGLVVCETTIRQTRFNEKGLTLASRIRKALQYADSIDKAVELLQEGNNGLYTNEWLIADVKTNEIAMFELGTHKTRLYRSSKNEWFGGTEGFYWGCNNTKDLEVRLETLPGTEDAPANMVFHPSDRDRVWQQLYQKHKGKIGVAFAREAFTTPPIAASHSLDAKFTTTALARDLKTWALFGPPLGRTWEPTAEEKQRYPEIQPLVSNPWTILHPASPGPAATGAVAVDLDSKGSHTTPATGHHSAAANSGGDEETMTPGPAWHGTILPKTDGDVWLATAFADYERLVAGTPRGRRRGANGTAEKSPDHLQLALFGLRSGYLTAIRSAADMPLARVQAEVSRDEWYRIAAGKGVLLLHELQKVLGDANFVEMMDSFGRTHAGQAVTTAEFVAHAEKAAGRKLDWFFKPWLEQPGLMTLRLGAVKGTPSGKAFVVEGEILREGPAPRITVEVVAYTPKGEVSKTVTLEGSTATFRIETDAAPSRVVVDPHDDVAKMNGAVFSTASFHGDLEHTLIVYGTTDEAPTNREAALELQKAIIWRGSNFKVPMKADRDVTESDLKENHLLLIGRPDSNSVVQRVQGTLPVSFGSRSFTVETDVYAHPGSALIVSAENPRNSQRSVVVIAGLSAASTLKNAPQLARLWQPAQVVVLPNGGHQKLLVLPAAELVRKPGE